VHVIPVLKSSGQRLGESDIRVKELLIRRPVQAGKMDNGLRTPQFGRQLRGTLKRLAWYGLR